MSERVHCVDRYLTVDGEEHSSREIAEEHADFIDFCMWMTDEQIDPLKSVDRQEVFRWFKRHAHHFPYELFDVPQSDAQDSLISKQELKALVKDHTAISDNVVKLSTRLTKKSEEVKQAYKRIFFLESGINKLKDHPGVSTNAVKELVRLNPHSTIGDYDGKNEES